LARQNQHSGQSARGIKPIRTWTEAETTLATLARLEQQLDQIESFETEAIARVRSEAESRRSIPASQRETLAAALERFTRKELATRRALNSVQVPRSLRLRAGRVGYRRAHAVVIRNEAAALRALAETRGGRRFLRVSQAINREALRALLMKAASDGSREGWRRRLRQAGVRLAERNYWFYEVRNGALGHRG
jgi:hypothetical protein